jgi:hypothetical protein
MPTKVPKTLIKSIDPSQIDSGGATNGQVLTYNGSTWVAGAAGGSIQAWVNFDATKDSTGAVSTANTNRLIKGSNNVSSVLRNGLGDFTITFTNALIDANYATQITVQAADTVPASVSFGSIYPSGTYTTTAVQISTTRGDRTAQVDCPINCITIIR